MPLTKPFGRSAGAGLAAALGAAFALGASGARAAEERYALSMLHFNVQYVAGGLVGFFATPDPTLDLTAEQVEDRIVVESFEPVLDMLLAHPTWGADIELQGYMIDVLAERHPGVLDKLRALAKSKQIDVVSFHYSDQLLLAYPREDWARSAALVRATFERHDIPLSTTVFCQEGQAGPGLASAMASAGYETLVFPRNLFSYLHGDAPPEPLHRLGDVSLVVSRGTSYDDGATAIATTWWFFDDGELLATGDFDPYIAERFFRSPEAIAKYEAELSALEADGWTITTVSKYVAAIEGRVAAKEAPPLLDGTWQPTSTDGIRRWLGGFGLWWADERDNDVRTLGALAHRELLAAEAIAAEAGLDAAAEIEGAFRLLALGQVTDATGINPFRGEIEYGLAHQAEALRIARDVIERAKAALGATAVAIDTASGAVTLGEAAPAPAPAAAEPFAIAVTAGDRSVETTWTSAAAGHHVVDIRFGPGDERQLTVTFPGTAGDIVYTPGLAEEPVAVPRDAFAFDDHELALSDGLIGLAPDRFVIKDQAMVHVAARVTRTGGDVLFHDDTTPAGEAAWWRFHVVTGDLATAAAVARSVNVTPKVWR